MSRVLPDQADAVPVRDEAEAHSYIAGVCFKHGPPTHVGVELEWFLTDPHDPARTPTADLLRATLGPHAPPSLAPPPGPVAGAEPVPLPGGSLVTVEPGGQIEISAPPAPSVAALLDLVHTDVAALDALLAPAGLVRSVRPPLTPRARVLSTPRYEAMERAFDAIGPHGRRMMCGSAATQICLDLGPAEQADERWLLAHRLGPVLLAAFATSSRPAGPVSSRMDAWWRLDPPRTRPPDRPELTAYVDRVLDTPVLAVRADEQRWTVDNRRTPRQWLAEGLPLTTADLDVHLSTLFPPVRPQGYLELRWLDAQTDEDWPSVVLLIAALFCRPAVVRAALDALAPADGRWSAATADGLRDPAVATAAARLAELVDPALAALTSDEPQLDPLAARRAARLAARRLVERITPAAELHTDLAADAAS